jgi:predicted metal-dependent hydrolase
LSLRCCEELPPEELLLAIDQFNQGDWFECHETLEELWVGEKGELRDFYQGLLQLAVALHHWRDGNFKGAMTLFKRGGECLERVPQVCQGVDVAGLRTDAVKLHEGLGALGEERMAELETRLILKVRLVEPDTSGMIFR